MNSLTLEDSIINCNREKEKKKKKNRRSTTDGSHPLRRETIDSTHRGNNGRSASFHDAATTRRVTWSDRYSVSVFDGGKSPARIAAEKVAQECHLLRIEDGDDMAMVATDVIPSLPFVDTTAATSLAPGAVHDDELSYHDVGSLSLSFDDISPTGKHDDEVTYYDIASYNLHLEMISLSPDEDSTTASHIKTLDYSLGEAPKCNDHMIIPTTREEGIEYASSLQPLDFAFVLCNDGQWTFSIVCDITQGKDRSEQPRMRFALDRHGSTKSIPRKNWGHKIRLLTDVNNRPLLQSSTTLPSPTATNAHSIHRSTHCRKCWIQL